MKTPAWGLPDTPSFGIQRTNSSDHDKHVLLLMPSNFQSAISRVQFPAPRFCVCQPREWLQLNIGFKLERNRARAPTQPSSVSKSRPDEMARDDAMNTGIVGLLAFDGVFKEYNSRRPHYIRQYMERLSHHLLILCDFKSCQPDAKSQEMIRIEGWVPKVVF
jgi:hypothetical protein